MGRDSGLLWFQKYLLPSVTFLPTVIIKQGNLDIPSPERKVVCTKFPKLHLLQKKRTSTGHFIMDHNAVRELEKSVF